MVLLVVSTEVIDEVKGGEDSSVIEEVGYNFLLSDGVYIICIL